MKVHLYLITIIFSFLIIINMSGYSQNVNNAPNKVLILHSMTEKRPWNLMYNSSFREAVKSNKKLDVEIFIENLDLLEHNSEEYKDLLEKMLFLKYENDLPDILIITQPTAVKFVFDRNLFANTPKILILPAKRGFEDYPNSTIITYAADFEVQFTHALKIFPETKEVYVVAGNSKIDKSTLVKFSNATTIFSQQISFNYLTNMDRDSILNKVKNLPENSFVYYLSYTQDLSGKAYMAKDFSFELAEYCNRPVFCYLDLLTENTGILGGLVVSLKSIATTTVDFIEQYSEGTEIENIYSKAPHISYTYDWDELIKWNINIDELPQESVLYNRRYTIFELYKYEVIVGIMLLLLYTFLLILLLKNNRKRKKSERDLLVKNGEYEAINEELTQTNVDLINANIRIEESRNHLHLFINTIPDLVWLKDVNGIYLECNNRFEELFGNKRKNIIGKSDYDFVSKDLADFFRQHDKAAMNAGKPTINEEQITFASDGHNEFLETIKTPLYSLEGDIVGVLGIGRDISQRVLAEQELLIAKEQSEEKEKKLKVAQEIAKTGSWDFYPETSVSVWSDQMFVLFDRDKSNGTLNFDEFMEYIHPEDVNRVITEYKNVLNNNNSNSFDCRLNTERKTPLWINICISSIDKSNEKQYKLSGTVTDISSRKQIENELIIAKEKAEESDMLKTEFIHNMSHEIRTPMNGILGFSDFLNNESLSDAKRKHYVSIIQNSGKQLMRIIDDILEISRLGTKQVKTIEKETCLNDLLLEHFSVFDIKAKENKTPLYLKKGLSDKESLIYTDETKLNKILCNLLENALKYTNKGFIEFGYKLKNNALEIYVKDTGIGVSLNKQEAVFERFSQEEKELSKNVGGLGLGLSIAKENTELLGGNIKLISEKGKGATFYITIPYKPANSNVLNSIENIQTKLEKFNVLIVEDEEVNYLYLEALLENEIKMNYEISHAKNGKEAVDICNENAEIDFILMDLKMPIMNGFEATKRIKKLKPNLPIVAQTAYTTNEDKEKAFSAGCDDFISKPISEETLNKIMNKYFIIK